LSGRDGHLSRKVSKNTKVEHELKTLLIARQTALRTASKVRADIQKIVRNGEFNMKKETTITGQPKPLVSVFEKLRLVAKQYPIFKENYTVEDVPLSRHCKAFDHSSSYILGVVVLVHWRKNEFHWIVQTQFVSKANGKNVKLNLLTKTERSILEKCKNQALGFIAPKGREFNGDALISEIKFRSEDYADLPPQVLEAIDGLHEANAMEKELIEEEMKERCAGIAGWWKEKNDL
jgi:hypothetical protein